MERNLYMYVVCIFVLKTYSSFLCTTTMSSKSGLISGTSHTNTHRYEIHLIFIEHTIEIINARTFHFC